MLKNQLITNKNDLFLTISIGLEHKDWHYKLVAAIFWHEDRDE